MAQGGTDQNRSVQLSAGSMKENQKTVLGSGKKIAQKNSMPTTQNRIPNKIQINQNKIQD